MTTWFTADTHFGHRNIIKYTNRPFSSVDEMDATLIHNWNARVAAHDHVYHLGDFALCAPARCRDILEQLNGQIHLIRGNHEKTADACKDKFASVQNYLELSLPDQDGHDGKRHLMLFHYAMRVWNGSHHGTYSLFGHSHGTLADDIHARAIDVGVDVHGFAPINYDEVKRLMEAKQWTSPFMK
ncbi:MAG: phosphoesterase [Bacteroidota bacterium]